MLYYSYIQEYKLKIEIKKTLTYKIEELKKNFISELLFG